MKKVSLILAALALVLGISQCKKQEDPMGKLVTQKVTFTTSFGDGSKLNPGEADGFLYPKWVVGDKIIVSDGVTTPASELECKKIENGGTAGVFEGTITCQEGAELTFSYNTIDWMNQDGSLQIYLKGTSGYQESGNYVVDMKMPCAILKLDLAKLAPASYVSVTIGDATEPAAKILNVTTENSEKYLLLPLTATEPTTITLTFSNETTTITKPYTLASNGFYTAGGNGGYAPVEPDAPATPKFTVDANGTTVEFAPGNLYYNGADDDNKMNTALPSGWNFYEHQWDYCTAATVGATNEISLFTWGYGSWSTDYTSYSYETGNKMTDWGEMVGDGWYTLSGDEWYYLLKERGKQRADANRFAKARVNGVNGLIIFPDNYNGTTSGDGITGINFSGTVSFPNKNIPSATWTSMESAGVVFLPAAGWRNNSLNVSFKNTNDYNVGYYWSTTSSNSNAKFVRFNANVNANATNTRGWHRSVRLVRNVE